MNSLLIKRFHEKAIKPILGSDNAAGYDLFSLYDYKIVGKGKEKIDTGIGMEIPHGYCGRIEPRSSLAWNNHIDVGAGVVDSDYRGRIYVILFNHGEEDFIGIFIGIIYLIRS
jgi:dUTP pyrophosphatase